MKSITELLLFGGSLSIVIIVILFGVTQLEPVTNDIDQKVEERLIKY